MIFLACAGLQVSTVNAGAIKVKSGQNSRVGIIGSYSLENCASLLPKLKVKSRAENGTATTKWVSSKITEGSCKGRSVNVIVIMYRSNKGFRGRDKITVNYIGPQGSRYRESNVNSVVTRKIHVNVN